MAFLDFLKRGKTAPTEQRFILDQKGQISVIGGAPTSAGVKISPESAMAISTVYACVSKISQTVAALDRKIYKSTEAGRDEQAHPALPLLTNMADEVTTSFNFWESIISDSLMYGCGFAKVEKNGNGQPAKLVWLPAVQVHLEERQNQETLYHFTRFNERTRRNETVYTYRAADLIIVPAFRSVSPINLHRETIGLARAAEDFGASFFGSGGHLSGVLTVEGGLSDEQFQALSNSWQSKYHGNNGAHATAILEHGINYERIGIPPDQAQFIETRKISAQEIARIFNVPAALIGLETNVTYSNVEQQSIFFATYTITPLVKRLEEELNEKLFSPKERASGMHVDFDLSSLLRADVDSRSEFYVKMLSHGVMSVNEVRKIEGLNPIAEGDQHVVQSGFVPLDALEEIHTAEVSANEAEPTNESSDGQKSTDGAENDSDDNEQA